MAGLIGQVALGACKDLYLAVVGSSIPDDWDVAIARDILQP